MRYYFTPTRIATNKTETSGGKGMKKLMCWWECKTVQSFWKLPKYLAVPLLGI